MRTEYKLYRWPTDTGSATERGQFATMEEAALAAAEGAGAAGGLIAEPSNWDRTRNDDGWVLAEYMWEPAGRTRPPALIAEVRVPETDAERIQLAVNLALEFGQTDGAHHKLWVIDQMVRLLAGDGYEALVAEYRAGEDGPDTYEWDEGIAP